MPKEIPRGIAKRFVDLCADNTPLDAFRILKSEGVIEDLKKQGIPTNVKTFEKIWVDYSNYWVMELYGGRTLKELLDALGTKGIFFNHSVIIGRLSRLHAKRLIDLKKMKPGSTAQKGPRRTSKQYKGVPHQPETDLFLRTKPPKKPSKRKSPPKRRPGK